MSTPKCERTSARRRGACCAVTAAHRLLPGPWQQFTDEKRLFSSCPPVHTPGTFRYSCGVFMPGTSSGSSLRMSCGPLHMSHSGRRWCSSSSCVSHPRMSTLAAKRSRPPPRPRSRLRRPRSVLSPGDVPSPS